MCRKHALISHRSSLMNASVSQTFQMNTLLSLKELSQITKLSRATIYAMLQPKSKYYDPKFPKQIYLTSNRVVWVAKEVNDWIEYRKSQRSV